MRLFLALASVVSLGVGLGSLSVAAPAKYAVDKDHSKISFTVRHMMISDVTGSFKDFDGSFMFDADKDAVSEGTFSAKTASISTDNAKRDEHLQSASSLMLQKTQRSRSQIHRSKKRLKITTNGQER